MSDFEKNNDFENENEQNSLIQDSDLIMESILSNINNTPIGQVLKKIASTPEVRKEKILDVRRQLHDGKYDVNKRLDTAVDKVLEDLVT